MGLFYDALNTADDTAPSDIDIGLEAIRKDTMMT